MPEVPQVKVSWKSSKAFALDVVNSCRALGLTLRSAMILTAHMAVSTGWGKHASSYRLAGIKATKESQSYNTLDTFEVIKGVRKPTTAKFRAFSSLTEGVRAILAQLHASRYAASRALLVAGDLGYFAQVGRDGWYTAKIDETAGAMLAAFNRIEAWVGGGAALAPIVSSLVLCALVAWG